MIPDLYGRKSTEYNTHTIEIRVIRGRDSTVQVKSLKNFASSCGLLSSINYLRIILH